MRARAFKAKQNLVIDAGHYSCKRLAAACISSRSARKGGEGLPRHTAATKTGAKSGNSNSRTLVDIFALGTATLKPMPKPPAT
jgi:hypothetical protein